MFGWLPRLLVWAMQWETRRTQRRELAQHNTASLFLIEMGFQQWR